MIDDYHNEHHEILNVSGRLKLVLCSRNLTGPGGVFGILAVAKTSDLTNLAISRKGYQIHEQKNEPLLTKIDIC